MIKSGIYKITNLINEKIYVGSSIDLKRRNRNHFKELIENKHNNQKLQRAFNKYGEENFKFEILELIEDKSQLISHEQRYLDLLNPQYNICKVAGSLLGTKRTKIQLEKLSKRPQVFKKGQVAWNKGSKGTIISSRRKPILQLDLDNNIIKEFSCGACAIEITKIKDIYDAIYGRQSQAGGFKWKFKDEKYNIFPKFKSKLKSIIQLDINSNILKEWTSASVATKELKLDVGSVLRGVQKTTGGFIFKYKEAA